MILDFLKTFVSNGKVNANISGGILPATVVNGQVTVAVAGTRIVLGGSTPLINGVTVKASSANTGVIYVGNSGVTSSNGYRLNADQSVFIACDSLADIYVDASVNASVVSYIGG